MSKCTSICWTRVDCPDHGRELWPRGRSAPLGVGSCCSKADASATNPRHLFDEHDSDRHFSDPEGWKAHVQTCHECNPQEGNE